MMGTDRFSVGKGETMFDIQCVVCEEMLLGVHEATHIGNFVTAHQLLHSDGHR